ATTTGRTREWRSPATPRRTSAPSDARGPGGPRRRRGPAVRDILDDIDRWRWDGRRVAIARLVGSEGSSPRLEGAAMAVSDGGEVAGSVSGGCVEGAGVTEALEV